MAFVVDDLGGWLVGLLADAGRKKLTALVLGSEQERALRRAATAAIQSTAARLAPSSNVPAERLEMVVGEVFRGVPGAALAGRGTLLEALQAGIAAQLAVLDDPGLTGTGQSSAEELGVSGSVLAEALARHLVQEIMLRGSAGGPLAPLADQLNHDVTHLQGQRIEGVLAELVDLVKLPSRRAVESGAILAVQGGVVVGQLGLAHQRATVGQPVRLALQPEHLAGREGLLADLDARLSAGDSPGPRMVVLCGLGGAGKTSVAVAYARRHLAGVGVAWQFSAEDPAVLAAGFGELAAQLGVRDLADTRDPVASVHAVLARYPGGWLLVFDNAADMASVAAFLPPAGPGRVLITSQNQNWPPGQALEVPVLDTEVAAAFLVARTGDQDRQAAAGLAGVLGGLPLALEQAAAYIQATGDSLAGYLALFGQRRADMLRRGEPAGYRKGKTVWTTWALAFDRLERSEPRAAGLLRLLACCAPEAVPLRQLLQPRSGLTGRLGPQVEGVLLPLLEDPLAAKDAIAALRRYSLISTPVDGSVSVHRLVQAVTADQMPAGLAAWRQAAAAVIGAAIPEDPQRPDTWPDFAALLPHAQAALTADSIGMGRIAAYLGFSGSYVTARELYRRVVEARERVLGPEHPDTLTARADLAWWTGDSGAAAAARDQYAALLPVIERVLGPEHPQTLGARAGLAHWTGQAGDAAAARDQYTALVPVIERVFGPEDPQTLGARIGLAWWTGAAGDAAAARDQYAAAARDQYAALLPVIERVFGPEHPQTLTARGNLAHWTGVAGDAAAARDLLAALVPVIERVSGAEHRDTLVNRADLAWWTGRAGDAAAARDLLAALVPVIERASGAEDPQTLGARVGLAWWTGAAGGAAAARDQYAALLPVRERVLGPEHPNTLIARADLARWTGRAGDAAAARDQYAALLPVRERVSGAEHPETQHVREELGYWTNEADGDVSSGVK